MTLERSLSEAQRPLTFRSRVRINLPLTNNEYSSAHKVEARQSTRRTLMRKVVVALTASAVVSGCANSQQQVDSHAPALNSWVGAPIEEFLDVQGTPTTVIDNVDYQIYKFVAWKRKHYFASESNCSPGLEGSPPGSEGAPGTYGAPGSPSRGLAPVGCGSTQRYTHTTTFNCTYELLVADNVINDWRMSGNYCRMMAVSHRPD